MSQRSHNDRPPLSHQLAILVFSGFYLIHWPGQATSVSSDLLQIGALAVFVLLYFIAFNFRRLTLACAVAMVALAFFMSPLNYGANTFAIYACSFFAYYQPPRRALLLSGLTLLVLLLAAFLYQLHLLYYFGISAIMIFGLSFSGIIDRQRMEHRRREQSSQEEIRRLAQIAERERIGQDLHDVIGHNLTGIHLKAQLASNQLAKGDIAAADEQCRAVARLAQLALKEIRVTLANIKRQSLSEELLAQETFLQSLGVELDFSLPEQPIPPLIESDLLLIIRELVTNALRHAHATQISLQFAMHERTLELQYIDNGRGMANTAEETFGSGLNGIRRRAHERGGSMIITSTQGLRIVITLTARARVD